MVLGGGRRKFMPHKRRDGRDLILEWKMKEKKAGRKYAYVQNRKQLKDIDPQKVDHVLGK